MASYLRPTVLAYVDVVPRLEPDVRLQIFLDQDRVEIDVEDRRRQSVGDVVPDDAHVSQGRALSPPADPLQQVEDGFRPSVG